MSKFYLKMWFFEVKTPSDFSFLAEPYIEASRAGSTAVPTTSTTSKLDTIASKITGPTEEMPVVSYDSSSFGGSPPGIRPPSDVSCEFLKLEKFDHKKKI